jgi:hypothetical protein
MIVDHNTIENASEMGLEVSQNSFGRIINNTIRHSGADGILVVGSASAHIGVLPTDDTGPSPNSILENGGDGIRVLRASTARIIGNSLTGNRRSGLSVQQASHADVAGNTFDGNGEHGIRVAGNSVMNLADSTMGLFTQPIRRPSRTGYTASDARAAPLWTGRSERSRGTAARKMCRIPRASIGRSDDRSAVGSCDWRKAKAGDSGRS